MKHIVAGEAARTRVAEIEKRFRFAAYEDPELPQGYPESLSEEDIEFMLSICKKALQMGEP